MAKVFTPKQEALLAAIVPGVKAGEIGTNWTVAFNGNQAIVFDDGQHPELNIDHYGWGKATLADFDDFVNQGIFTHRGEGKYSLHQMALLRAYELNFDFPVAAAANQTFNFPHATFTGITNISTTLHSSTQYIQNAPGLDKGFKQQFDALITELREALIPFEGEKDANAVAKHAERLAQDVADEDKEEVESSLEKLTKAAKNLAGVTPIVLPIALRIAELISTLPK